MKLLAPGKTRAHYVLRRKREPLHDCDETWMTSQRIQPGIYFHVADKGVVRQDRAIQLGECGRRIADDGVHSGMVRRLVELAPLTGFQ